MQFLFALLSFVPMLIGSPPDGAKFRLSDTLIISSVTVIDPSHRRIRPDMTVVMVKDRIVSVGKTSGQGHAAGTRYLNGTGKYLIPGLWDMHAHLGEDVFDRRAALSLYVANGVTGIRIMDGLPAHHRWRMQILRGQLIGPEMVIASRIIGLDHWVGRSHEAEQLVLQAKREGADFIKVHDSISREAYFALMSEAKRLELPVEGHVPISVSAGEASNIGQRSIEHFTGLDGAAQDTALAKSVLDTLAANRTWVCPTLVMRHHYARLQDVSLLRDPRLSYLPSAATHWWLDLVRGSAKVPQTEWEGRKRLVRMEDELVARMEKSGIGLLAGTDNGNPFCYPGFSLPEELELLVQVGLSPWEALQAATVNPTRLLENSDSLGEIARGKIADLVLLNANPILDIRNIRRISSVILRGKLFERPALDGLLARARSLAKSPARLH